MTYGRARIEAVAIPQQASRPSSTNAATRRARDHGKVKRNAGGQPVERLSGGELVGHELSPHIEGFLRALVCRGGGP
jgi:hypothetical protein